MSIGKGWLTPSQQRRIGRAVATLLPLGKTYQVCSSLFPEAGRIPRDIDLRLMLDDDIHSALAPQQWAVIADHIGRSIEVEAGVGPIDFQIQSVSEANAEHPGMRSAIFLDDNLAAAEAKLADVREALAAHPRVCDIHDADDPISCGWKRAVASVESALGTDR